MDTAAAAQQAGVTVATIRTWCRLGVVAAVKRGGRWIIDAASLAYRITLGRKPMTIEPLTRDQFEAEARKIGVRHPFKDARALGEYQLYTRTGEQPDDDYTRLLIRRGAALVGEGYTPPAPARGPGYAAGLPGQVFGGPSADRADECHYCGQPLGPSGECDECR